YLYHCHICFSVSLADWAVVSLAINWHTLSPREETVHGKYYICSYRRYFRKYISFFHFICIYKTFIWYMVIQYFLQSFTCCIILFLLINYDRRLDVVNRWCWFLWSIYNLLHL